MDKSSLLALVVELYAAIQTISGYPVPQAAPAVHLVPGIILQDLVCLKPCQIRAFYHPDFGILIDDSFELAGSSYHQSVLLHELVHHAQHISGKFDSLSGRCQQRAAAETEAYEIQNGYLALKGASERIPILKWGLVCRDEGSPSTAQ